MTGEDVGLRWQAFLRRFDLEHNFRMLKQTLAWARPRLRGPDERVRVDSIPLALAVYDQAVRDLLGLESC